MATEKVQEEYDDDEVLWVPQVQSSTIIRETGTRKPSEEQTHQQSHPVPSADKINVMPAGKGKRCKRPWSISVIQAANSEPGADR